MVVYWHNGKENGNYYLGLAMYLSYWNYFNRFYKGYNVCGLYCHSGKGDGIRFSLGGPPPPPQ